MRRFGFTLPDHVYVSVMAAFDEDKRRHPLLNRYALRFHLALSFCPLPHAGGTLTFDEFVGLLAEVTSLTNQFKRYVACVSWCSSLSLL